MSTKGEAILLLESVQVEPNLRVYRVTTNKGFLNFLSLEDAKTYAGKVLTDGITKKTEKKTTPPKKSGPGGFRVPVPPAESRARREFLIKAMSTGMSMRNLAALAKTSNDPVIRKVPLGSWSSIIHSMAMKKKIGAIGRENGKLVYKSL